MRNDQVAVIDERPAAAQPSPAAAQNPAPSLAAALNPAAPPSPLRDNPFAWVELDATARRGYDDAVAALVQDDLAPSSASGDNTLRPHAGPRYLVDLNGDPQGRRGTVLYRPTAAHEWVLVGTFACACGQASGCPIHSPQTSLADRVAGLSVHRRSRLPARTVAAAAAVVATARRGYDDAVAALVQDVADGVAVRPETYEAGMYWGLHTSVSHGGARGAAWRPYQLLRSGAFASDHNGTYRVNVRYWPWNRGFGGEDVLVLVPRLHATPPPVNLLAVTLCAIRAAAEKTVYPPPAAVNTRPAATIDRTLRTPVETQRGEPGLINLCAARALVTVDQVAAAALNPAAPPSPPPSLRDNPFAWVELD